MSLRLKELLSFPQECGLLFVSIWKHLLDRWVIFPSRQGSTGQKGIHRDLGSNDAVDIQLLLALKFNYQVIFNWPCREKQTTCKKPVCAATLKLKMKLKMVPLIAQASFIECHVNYSRRFRAVKWPHAPPLKPSKTYFHELRSWIAWMWVRHKWRTFCLGVITNMPLLLPKLPVSGFWFKCWVYSPWAVWFAAA